MDCQQHQCCSQRPEKVTFTLTAKCGTATETKTFETSLSKLSNPADIVKASYALADGESLPVNVTLSGVITEIKDAYSEKYGNISVIIVVEDMGDMPILCYRLIGDGIDKLAVGDNITVTGKMKKYKGTIEFDSKCTLDAAKTQAAIVDELYALADGKALESKYTLTGEIVSVDEAYSEKYGNVTVSIKVGEKTVKCYRLKGDAAATIAAGDTITVYGALKNYKGTYEFDSGCKIVAVVKAGA